MSMRGLLICRIRGIDIRLNWSVAVAAALITWSLADTLFPDVVEGRSDAEYWIAGGVTTVLFLASLVAHEVGHAVVAQRENVEVRAITLWLFGGVAELGSKPPSPGAALRIAAAGPAVSGVLGLVAIAVSVGLEDLPQAAAAWLGLMNMILMAFNLLPAFPLDGGRIYQAWLWRRGGDELTATTRAVAIGLRTGAVMVGLGVLEIVLGGFVGGIWLMAIGWFVREAGRTEWRAAVIDRPLTALTAADVMSPGPITVPATTDIDTFIADLLHGGRHAAYPVTGADGTVTGLITVSRVREAITSDLSGKTVQDLATPVSAFVVTTPATPVVDLLAELNGRANTRALVFDDGHLVGIIAPSDLTRLISVVELAAMRQ